MEMPKTEAPSPPPAEPNSDVGVDLLVSPKSVVVVVDGGNNKTANNSSSTFEPNAAPTVPSSLAATASTAAKITFVSVEGMGSAQATALSTVNPIAINDASTSTNKNTNANNSNKRSRTANASGGQRKQARRTSVEGVGSSATAAAAAATLASVSAAAAAVATASDAAAGGGGGGTAAADLSGGSDHSKKLNRFSDLEKSLLYAHFREHQQIIDIKQRRSSYSSHKQAEVRARWESIVEEFNAHPATQKRTMRQIQKFWLNSKLRNQIPTDDNPASHPSAIVIKTEKPVAIKNSPTPPSSTASVTMNKFASMRAAGRGAGTVVKRTIKNDGTIVPTITTYTIQPMKMVSAGEDAANDVQQQQHVQLHQQQQQQQHHHHHHVTVVSPSASLGASNCNANELMHEVVDADEDDNVDDDGGGEEILEDQCDEVDEEEDNNSQMVGDGGGAGDGQVVIESEMMSGDDDGAVEDMIELKFIDAHQRQHHHPQQHQQQQQRVQSVQVHENGSLQLVGHADRTEYTNLEQLEMIAGDDNQQHYATAGNSIHSTGGGNNAAVDKRRLFCGSDCGTDRDGSAELINPIYAHSHQHQQQQQQHNSHAHQVHHQHQHTAIIDEGIAAEVSDPHHHHHHQQQQQQHHPAQQQHAHHHQMQQHAVASDEIAFTEQLNELRLQEAQFRLKEAELRCELQQLGVQRAHEELRQSRELHVLHISEVQLKLDKMKKELRLSMT